MFLEAVLLGIIAGIGVLDSRIMGVSMIDRPIVMCTLVGFVLGDIETALVIGATLELIFLGTVTIGAAIPPDIVTGSVLACSLAILTNSGTETALALALPVSLLSQQIGILIRIVNASIVQKAEKNYHDTGNNKVIAFYHLVPTTLMFFLNGFVVVFLGVYFGVDFVNTIITSIPQVVMDGLKVASSLIPALGFALLASMMLNKKMVPFFALGFVLAAYANLDIIAVAILSLIMVAIMEIQSSKGGMRTNE